MAVAAAIGVLATASCAHPGRSGRAPATSTSRPVSPGATTTSLTSTPPTTRPCLSKADIDRWPIATRAALLVVVPSLNFDVAGLSALVRSGVGGLLFLGSVAAPADLPDRLSAAEAGLDAMTRPLVMADVEGGGVQRLAGVVQPFPWPRQMAASMSPAQVEQLAATVGREMADAGVTVDLAPVLDLDGRPGPTPQNPDGSRSFGADPATASAYGIAFLRGLGTAGVLAVAKHFPGLGGSSGNTDYGPATSRPYAELEAGGLRPFSDAIAAGVPAVMVSNAATPGLSSGPASLSAAVLTGLLRGQLGFRGLIVTDSLSAGAIADAGYTVAQAAAAAVASGADLVLFGSTLTAADTALLSPAKVAATEKDMVDALVAAHADGRLTGDRFDEAVGHVMTAKGVAVCP